MAAKTIFKASSEYRDPNTGTIYLNGVGNKSSSTTAPSSGTNVVSNVTSNNNTVTSPATTSSARSSAVKTVKATPSDYSYEPFKTSSYTNNYASRLQELEDNEPDEYSSKYDDTIASLVDKITNKKSFNLSDDTNYNQLYNNYKERYTANAKRAMNDTLASANAATGGYGSTYGQIAAQQAYDQQMEGLNDDNITLAQLAYQMYGDEIADNYNQLSAVTGLDNTDYSRYRDDVNDYYTDLNYYANRADTSYDRDYTAWNNDRQFDYSVSQQAYQNDYERYQNALSQAQSYAANGLTPPSSLTSIIDEFNTKYGYGNAGDAAAQLQALATQAVANASGGGSSGRSKGKAKTGSNGTTSSTKTYSSNIIQPLINSGLVLGSADLSGMNLDSDTEKLLTNISTMDNLAKAAQNYNFLPTTQSSSTTKSSSDSKITNRNGDGWIYVDGFGKLMDEEVYAKTEGTNPTIKEINNGDGTVTYKKIK